MARIDGVNKGGSLIARIVFFFAKRRVKNTKSNSYYGIKYTNTTRIWTNGTSTGERKRSTTFN